MSNNFFKYIFAAVVIILVVYTAYMMIQKNSLIKDEDLDHTSTLTNIQTDLRLAIAELDTLNPLLSNNRNVQEVSKIIYDPLITLDGNYKKQYCLAEEIAKTDDVTYTVKLRKGVLWENRTNFTSDDVKYTIDLLKAGVSPIYNENVAHIANTEIIDATTIQIVLDQPISFFEYNLTFPIMCKSYYGEEDFVSSEKVPIGTGMFKITDFSSNVVQLEPNEYYWDISRKPMITKINVNLYATMGEVYQAFKNGEIDILNIKINNVEDYIGTLGYNKIEFKGRDYDFLSFNTENELFSDPIVRKAISLAIDKNNIVSVLGKGYTSTNFSIDNGNWLYTRELNFSIDTEQAAQLLMNDGWVRTSNAWQKKYENGTRRLEFRLVVNNEDPIRMAAAENIKAQLANFGVNVYIDAVPYDRYADIINNSNYQTAIAGIRLGFSPSVETFFANGNIANYYNEEVQEIIDTVGNTNDEQTLYDSYSRLYDIYMEEVPYTGLYRNTELIIANQRLVNNITPNSFNMYHNIEKWYRQ